MYQFFTLDKDLCYPLSLLSEELSLPSAAIPAAGIAEDWETEAEAPPLPVWLKTSCFTTS